LFAIGRRDLLNQRLGQVHPRFRAPAAAVAFAGLLTAAASFSGQGVLVPISEVGSLASAFGWLATYPAFCAGAAGEVTPRAKMIGVAGSAVAAMLILIKVLPWVPGSFRSYEFMALAGWIVLGAILWHRRAEHE
jgi:amino acid transporter